ncbi:MAG: hypothetical protein ABW277_11395, partial [Longimicrobiaceae bacterium]
AGAAAARRAARRERRWAARHPSTPGDAMAASTFEVTLRMSTSTVVGLTDSGFSLLAFAAVQSFDLLAQPLVWMTTRQYSATTVVRGAMRFQAYTVPADTASQVVPGFSADIAPGQLLTVHHASGIGTVTEDGVGGVVAIYNATRTPLWCGIAQEAAGAFAPVCLLPLHGGNAQVVVPVPVILLMFSISPAILGTTVDTASGPGVLLDLGATLRPEVGYDIDEGWSWGETTWGRAVEFGAELRPLLTGSPG